MTNDENQNAGAAIEEIRNKAFAKVMELEFSPPETEEEIKTAETDISDLARELIKNAEYGNPHYKELMGRVMAQIQFLRSKLSGEMSNSATSQNAENSTPPQEETKDVTNVNETTKATKITAELNTLQADLDTYFSAGVRQPSDAEARLDELRKTIAALPSDFSGLENLNALFIQVRDAFENKKRELGGASPISEKESKPLTPREITEKESYSSPEDFLSHHVYTINSESQKRILIQLLEDEITPQIEAKRAAEEHRQKEECRQKAGDPDETKAETDAIVVEIPRYVHYLEDFVNALKTTIREKYDPSRINYTKRLSSVENIINLVGDGGGELLMPLYKYLLELNGKLAELAGQQTRDENNEEQPEFTEILVKEEAAKEAMNSWQIFLDYLRSDAMKQGSGHELDNLKHRDLLTEEEFASLSKEDWKKHNARGDKTPKPTNYADYQAWYTGLVTEVSIHNRRFPLRENATDQAAYHRLTQEALSGLGIDASEYAEGNNSKEAKDLRLILDTLHTVFFEPNLTSKDREGVLDNLQRDIQAYFAYQSADLDDAETNRFKVLSEFMLNPAKDLFKSIAGYGDVEDRGLNTSQLLITKAQKNINVMLDDDRNQVMSADLKKELTKYSVDRLLALEKQANYFLEFNEHLITVEFTKELSILYKDFIEKTKPFIKKNPLLKGYQNNLDSLLDRMKAVNQRERVSFYSKYRDDGKTAGSIYEGLVQHYDNIGAGHTPRDVAAKQLIIRDFFEESRERWQDVVDSDPEITGLLAIQKQMEYYQIAIVDAYDGVDDNWIHAKTFDHQYIATSQESLRKCVNDRNINSEVTAALRRLRGREANYATWNSLTQRPESRLIDKKANEAQAEEKLKVYGIIMARLCDKMVELNKDKKDMGTVQALDLIRGIMAEPDVAEKLADCPQSAKDILERYIVGIMALKNDGFRSCRIAQSENGCPPSDNNAEEFSGKAGDFSTSTGELDYQAKQKTQGRKMYMAATLLHNTGQTVFERHIAYRTHQVFQDKADGLWKAKIITENPDGTLNTRIVNAKDFGQRGAEDTAESERLNGAAEILETSFVRLGNIDTIAYRRINHEQRYAPPRGTCFFPIGHEAILEGPVELEPKSVSDLAKANKVGEWISGYSKRLTKNDITGPAINAALKSFGTAVSFCGSWASPNAGRPGMERSAVEAAQKRWEEENAWIKAELIAAGKAYILAIFAALDKPSASGLYNQSNLDQSYKLYESDHAELVKVVLEALKRHSGAVKNTIAGVAKELMDFVNGAWLLDVNVRYTYNKDNTISLNSPLKVKKRFQNTAQNVPETTLFKVGGVVSEKIVLGALPEYRHDKLEIEDLLNGGWLMDAATSAYYRENVDNILLNEFVTTANENMHEGSMANIYDPFAELPPEKK